MIRKRVLAVTLTLFQKRLMGAVLRKSLGFVLILSFLIWLAQSLRLGHFAAYQGASVTDVALMVLGSLPRILVLTLPIGLCCAILTVSLKLRHEREYDAASSFGVTPWFFAWPSLLIAGLFSGISYIITLKINPHVVQASKDKKHSLSQIIDPGFLTPGVFFQLGPRTLYVHSQTGPNLFEGLFVYDHSRPGHELFLTGQRARFSPKDNGFMIQIENGTHHSFFTAKPPVMSRFTSYTLDIIPPKSLSRAPHLQELPLGQLVKNLNNTRARDLQAWRRLYQEWIQRLILPLLCLVDGLWVTLCVAQLSSPWAILGWGIGGVTLIHGAALVLPKAHWVVAGLGGALVLAWAALMAAGLWQIPRRRRPRPDGPVCTGQPEGRLDGQSGGQTAQQFNLLAGRVFV